jgi:hypothetical protein
MKQAIKVAIMMAKTKKANRIVQSTAQETSNQ